ncbi:MAG: hypothetical protein PHV20_01635 [Bacteroidales bacterium]|nr:hypothetical protein [Bacteroidales bacterium]
MNFIRKTILPILLATIWISISEFVRNELLFKNYWVDHYQQLGLAFPSAPINGAMWGVWSLLLSIAIYILLKKFSLIQAVMLAWFMAFVMMWFVIGNLDVLPYKLLYFAIPLSLLEVYIATFILKKLSSQTY